MKFGMYNKSQAVEILSGVFSAVCTVLTWFFGEFDGALRVLVALIIVDYVLEILGAAMNRTLNSKEQIKITRQKLIIFALVGMAHVIGRELMSSAMLRDVVIYFYIANEGISIIENADRAKVPVPEILKKIFKQLHNLRESNSENKVDAKAIKLDNNTKQI